MSNYRELKAHNLLALLLPILYGSHENMSFKNGLINDQVKIDDGVYKDGQLLWAKVMQWLNTFS